ncbi:MAG: sugar ABC transporter permease [Eubacteriales bacterium]|nr:sugar ABC transporter permease [Eubacteriales bacterium]
MKKKKNWTGVLWILPSLSGVLLFYCIPWLDVFRRAFARSTGQGFAGLENFRKLFQNEAFLLASKNTLRFILICIPVLLAGSLALAVLIQRCRYGAWYKWMLLLPMALPAVSTALIWKLLFHRYGLLNAVLERMGLPVNNWLNSSAAFWILVFSYLWRNSGYHVILWLAGLKQIDSSIYEAARIDGAGEFRIFRSMTLPNLKQVFATAAVLSMLNSFKVFREAYLVAGNYPHDSMYMMQHLFNNWFRILALDKMSAASVLLSIVILSFLGILYKVWGKEMG